MEKVLFVAIVKRKTIDQNCINMNGVFRVNGISAACFVADVRFGKPMVPFRHTA